MKVLEKGKNILSYFYYLYKRNNWVFDSLRPFKSYERVEIDRPIFFLGVQGAGLTLISRMLRRNKKVISVTGDYKYWYGADEMQNVLWPILPVEFAGIKYRYPDGGEFITPRGWLYATNELINYYRMTEKDVTPEFKDKFSKIIRWLIARHGKGEGVRFTDKSQVFTIKVSFINEILKNSDPKFVLITRNPYALCYRSVFKKGKAPELKKVKRSLGEEKTLKLAAEHWNNSINFALEDEKKVQSFLTVKLEDFLKEPKKKLKEICESVEIDFEDKMLPSKNNKPGLGTRSFPDKKWYPLKKDVNSRYLKEISRKELEIIDNVCGKTAKALGYKKP